MPRGSLTKDGGRRGTTRCQLPLTCSHDALAELFLGDEAVIVDVHAPEQVGDAHLLRVGVLHKL